MKLLLLLVHIIIRQPAAQHQLAGGLDLIHASELGGAGGVVQQLGLGLGFLRDLDQRVGEGIQRVLVLGLGRLDHQRLVDDEREVVCGRMEVVIHQALGDVEGADVRAFEASFGHELVHADAVERDVIGVAQSGQQVVGVQHGVLCNVLRARPVRAWRCR